MFAQTHNYLSLKDRKVRFVALLSALSIVVTAGFLFFDVKPAQAASCTTSLTADPSSWSANPRPISNFNELVWLSNWESNSVDLTANYILTANINLAGCEFTPIGNDNGAFQGDFDGDGYKISSLTIVNTSDVPGIGFFGVTDGAAISNLHISGGSVTVTNQDIEGVGGLVGVLSLGSITGSSFTGEVVGEPQIGGEVGGLVGFAENTLISKSFAEVDVTAGGDVGGLVGRANDSRIEYSFSTGTVTSFSTYTAGLAGTIGGSQILDSYSLSEVIADSSDVGGFFGRLNDTVTVTNSYSAGQVSGTTDVGGFVGVLSQNSIPVIISSFWDTETSTQSTSAGGVGKTTAEMHTLSTYTGWEIASGWAPFNPQTAVWGICSGVNGGYPFLLWEYTSTPCQVTPNPSPSNNSELAATGSGEASAFSLLGVPLAFLALGGLSLYFARKQRAAKK
jgi:LPXTG-motif cell wall-anchored protein